MMKKNKIPGMVRKWLWKEKWMLDRGLKENTNDFIDISSINIEKNYKLNNGNYFHFHTNDEGYYYAIYDNRGTEIDGGL